MSELARLLEVQGHDTLADQLRHRRLNLPEREDLAAATVAQAANAEALATVASNRMALAGSQDRLEADIATARERIKVVEGALYGGAVNSPRELQALQDEIASLQRRIGLLEDEELAVMEQLEPIDAAAAEHAAERVRLEADIERLETAITTGEAEVEVEIAANDVARAESILGIDPGLLSEYEQIRGRSGGIAAAPLTGGQCGGCHMRLSSVELDRLKKQPDDAVIHCEECGRLLVR